MFNENLKMLRKRKGFTQEELAIKVNVVRQTVSKWEKGLSVPDAEVLQKIAEVLDVGVNELLGANMAQDVNKNEIAEQLARLNEQFAIKNKRWKVFWKVVGIILLVCAVINIVSGALFRTVTKSGGEQISVEEVIIDEEYTVE